MLPNVPLTNWLSSPDQREASYKRSVLFSDRWTKHRLMVETEMEVMAHPNPTVEMMLAAASRFMNRRDELQEMIDNLVTHLAADPFFRPPVSLASTPISQGYVLYDNDRLTISLNVISAEDVAAKKMRGRGEGTVGFTGMVTLYRYWKSGDATFSFWEAPAADDIFSGEEAQGLKMTEQRRIRDGESWVMDGRRQSFIVENMQSDIVQLQAQVKIDCAPLAVEYDIKTGLFVGATATDDASSRTQMMVTLLRLLGRDDAWPLIVRLLDSPHFFTRWHLMREFLAVNADAALPHLRDMAANDPHPEVRAAASQTLTLLLPDRDQAEGQAPCPA
jgi:hypothetical protein